MQNIALPFSPLGLNVNAHAPKIHESADKLKNRNGITVSCLAPLLPPSQYQLLVGKIQEDPWLTQNCKTIMYDED